jgi:TRAP-type C4-dicarboxylate transport system permease small subunit
MYNKMCRVIFLISYGLDKICRASSIGFLGLMVLLVLFQVLARYIFQAVPIWTDEAARYCMVWGCLLGATVAFRTDYDPRLIQPPETGPKAWIISATFLRAIATVVFLGPVLYHSNRFLARNFHRVSDGMEISMAFIVAVVPIFIVIIFVHLTARLLGDEKRKKG